MTIESLRKHVARGKEFALRKIYSIPCEELEAALAEYDKLCARVVELQTLLGKVEEWMSRDEDGHSLRNLWDDGLVGAYEYDDGGDVDWPETLSRIRDCSIPLEQLGTDSRDYQLEEVTLYREILGALAKERNQNES